jgi:hypothetical protein
MQESDSENVLPIIEIRIKIEIGSFFNFKKIKDKINNQIGAKIICEIIGKKMFLTRNKAIEHYDLKPLLNKLN